MYPTPPREFPLGNAREGKLRVFIPSCGNSINEGAMDLFSENELARWSQRSAVIIRRKDRIAKKLKTAEELVALLKAELRKHNFVKE